MTSATAQQQAADEKPRAPAGFVAPALGSAETITVDAEAGNVRVFAIPIPESLSGRAANYRFIKQGDFTVLGRLERTLASDETKRPITLSIAVPASAPSGATKVGIVRFSCDSACSDSDVALVVRVLPRLGLSIMATRTVFGARAGARARSEVILSNTGNASEPVTITIAAPNGWRWRVLLPTPMVISPGASMIVPVELSIPTTASAGDYGAVLRAVSAGGATAEFALNVHVSSGALPSGASPLLETSLAVVHEPGFGTTTAIEADLSGEIFPNVWANGQLTGVRTGRLKNSGAAQQALGRQGYSSNTDFLQLRAPHWNAGLGNIGYDGDGVAGGRVWGVGANAAVSSTQWRGSLFAAQPDGAGGESGDAGRYMIGSLSRQLGPTWTGIAFSSLRDQSGGGRSSSSVAAEALLPLRGGEVQVQIGQRRAGDDPGRLAWVVSARQHAETWGANVLAARLPGGAAAFARAQDELVFDGYRQLGRVVTLGASFWRNEDRGRNSQGLFDSNGWSVSPQLSFGRLGSLLIESRTSSYHSSTLPGELGNAASDISASWSAALGDVQGTIGTTRGTVTRRTDLGDVLSVSSRASRQAFFASFAASTALGVWQLDARHDRAGAGVGLPSLQSSMGLRGDGIPIIPGIANAYAEATAYYLGASRTWLSSQVVGVDVRLGNAYGLVIDAARDQLRGTAGGTNAGTPWLLTTRLRYSLALPARGRTRVRGMVFNDLNGDGILGTGEKGVPGVVLHVNSDIRSTDSKGRFEAGALNSDRVAIDPGSLPPGLMVPPQLPGKRSSGSVFLAVIPTTGVWVQLRLASTTGIDSSKVHLADALVFLNDSLGRRWTGVPDEKGVLHFDALPPGIYTVSADLSRMSEVLTLPDILPTVRVDGADRSLRVVLLLAPRRIRLLPPPGAPIIIRAIGGGRR